MERTASSPGFQGLHSWLPPLTFSFGGMKLLKRAGIGFAVIGCFYLLLPLAVFDFTSAARPYDEEYFATREVAIGPKPYWWVPMAAWKLDVPGGFSYDASGWPFVLWKPLCLAFIKAKGYAPPAEWRR